MICWKCMQPLTYHPLLGRWVCPECDREQPEPPCTCAGLAGDVADATLCDLHRAGVP